MLSYLAHLIEQGAKAILQQVTLHTFWALFGFIGLEEAGIPLPISGDILLIFAGSLYPRHQTALWQIMPAAILGVASGSSVLYWVARLGGHTFIARLSQSRLGRLLHITPQGIARSSRWLCEHEAITILIGRQVPGLRTVTSIVAGVFEVPYPHFLLLTVLASLVWSGYLVLIGALFQWQHHRLFERVRHHPVISGLVFLCMLTLGVFAVRRLRRRS